MSVNPDFLNMLNCVVGLAAKTTRDEYGNPAIGASTNYPARVNKKARLLALPGGGGEQVVSSGEVWLAYSGSISTSDLLTLPNGDQPLILSIDQPYDETGAIYYTKVFFK